MEKKRLNKSNKTHINSLIAYFDCDACRMCNCLGCISNYDAFYAIGMSNTNYRHNSRLMIFTP